MSTSLPLDRSDALCVWCRSRARTRHLAVCAADAFAGRGVEWLGDFQHRPEFVVANTSHGTPLATALGDAANIHHSEFFDDVAPGDERNGVRCEDLTALTHADKSLDLLISEDVLEHVPDTQLAISEMARVIRPGGVHVFTVPFSFARRSNELFDVVDGQWVLREPIEYHGDLVRGRVATYHHFGWDLLDWMDEAGFDTTVKVASTRQQREIGAYDCTTFVARRL